MAAKIGLKEFFERILLEHSRLHDSEREASRLALENAREEIERRLIALNELRSEVTQDRSQFIQRQAFEVKIEAMEKDIRLLRDDMSAQHGRQAAYAIVFGIVAFVTPIVVTVLLNRGG